MRKRKRASKKNDMGFSDLYKNKETLSSHKNMTDEIAIPQVKNIKKRTCLSHIDPQYRRISAEQNWQRV